MRSFRRGVANAFCVFGGAFVILASTWELGDCAGSEPPLPPVRPPSSEAKPAGPATPAPSLSTASPPESQPSEAAACLAELKGNQVDAQIVPAPPAPIAECGVAHPVRLDSIGASDAGRVDLPGHPILDCAFALVFTAFVRDLMAPLAASMLGSPVASVGTGLGYRCASPIRLPSGSPNPHGEGIAIDVTEITLADHRRIAVGHEANSAEALFVRTMRKAACGWFTTVLGPGSNAAHAEHFHFDILRHGSSDNYRICE